jgi:hypothetical protein
MSATAVSAPPSGRAPALSAAGRRGQKQCAWCGVVFLVLFAVGMVALAQFVPPPKASDSAQQVVRLYGSHTDRLRAGLVLMMIAAGFTAPWCGVISVQLKRIEGRFSPFAYTQLACGAAGVLVILLPVMVMIVASFRPSRDPQILQTLNDLAWIPFIMVFPPVMIQCLSIAGAILNHDDQQVLPRWLGYFNVWCAVLLVPAVLIPFFKTGPFAWHGIFEFWLAAVVFFGWFAVMTFAVLRAIDAGETLAER